jgi:hypothetical protein
MAGRLDRIESIVNNTVSHYAHVKVFPRGLPFFVDPLLRGTIRFGKRTGNNIAVINVDNTFKLTKATQVGDSQVTIERASEWINLGCIVSMGPGKELQSIADIDETLITFEGKLGQAYSPSDLMLLVGFPMILAADVAIGATTITVRSHYPLANGDVVAYLQTDGLLESLTEIRSNQAQFAGTTTDPFFTQLYNLTLDNPMGRAIKADSMIFLRAFPAYFSQAIPVPAPIASPEPLGPFLVDALSGRLLEGNSYRETLGFRTLNRAGIHVLGNPFEYVTIEKNKVIMDRPWSAHLPMFWEIAEGTMRLTPNKLLMRVNENLQFCVGLKCVPHLEPGTHVWRLNLKANDDCSIRFRFHPYEHQEFTLASGVVKTILLNMPTGTDLVTDLEINILSFSPTCEVAMSDWTPVDDTVVNMEYSLVIEATGIASYQSTGLVVKPYFMSADFLRTNYDLGSTNDGGKVYF